MRFKDVLAKTIRVISVPPVMVTSLILILAFNRDGIFRSTSEVVISILLLGFVPVLAYGCRNTSWVQGSGQKGSAKARLYHEHNRLHLRAHLGVRGGREHLAALHLLDLLFLRRAADRMQQGLPLPGERTRVQLHGAAGAAGLFLRS